MALVVNRVFFHMYVNIGVKIRQMKKGLRPFNSKQIRGIEAKEIYAWLIIDGDVCPYVQFRKRRSQRNLWQKPCAHGHVKRRGQAYDHVAAIG